MMPLVMNELDVPRTAASWREHPAAQQPPYPDAEALAA
ncbi:MAG: 3-deoxy-7-phosphoheptulonate synthase, partial [Actinomyces urogenitalis DORA_12]